MQYLHTEKGGHAFLTKRGHVMNFKHILVACISAAIFSACTSSEPQETADSVTATETTVSTINPYALVRGWLGHELLESIYFNGAYRPLPMNIEDSEDLRFSDGILQISDFYSANAELNEEGEIIYLHFSRETAPLDFSVYGVGFDAKPSDIPDKIGIADSIIGHEDSQMTYSFYGGGINRLEFFFDEKVLTDIIIAA